MDNSSIFITSLTETMHDISQAKDDKVINDIIESLLMKFTDSDWATLYLYDSKNQSRVFTQKKTITPYL